MLRNCILDLINIYVDGVLNNLDKDELKKELIKNLTSCSFSEKMVKVNESLDEGLNALRSLGYCVIDIKARTKKKLYVGVSEISPFYLFFETGLMWNLALDLPYIPGSTIKGILRSYMIDLCRENEECISYVYQIFGIPENERHRSENVEIYVTGLDYSSSLLVALDSYPISGDKLLAGNIITQHYFKGGKVVENEYQANPTPLLRVAINEGVTFRFVIGMHHDAISLFQEWANSIGYKGGSLSFFVPILYAFRQGIGAKTSRDYGEFNFEDFSLVSFNFTRPKKLGKVRVRVNGRR
ncbi:type III-B CRISPR module RAMP protein Cmr6 [Saccharolobus islandicus]|uniref:type III-B CRISPR module RAMP protein Cmr6 n=1 Tax=Saccharolobus islandicus TaxID=43080 RepID=UPI00036892AC|nr:type III-B CRISPR module RAMP protein Cmr6 [Sulfolobus islandicus]